MGQYHSESVEPAIERMGRPDSHIRRRPMQRNNFGGYKHSETMPQKTVAVNGLAFLLETGLSEEIGTIFNDALKPFGPAASSFARLNTHRIKIAPTRVLERAFWDTYAQKNHTIERHARFFNNRIRQHATQRSNRGASVHVKLSEPEVVSVSAGHLIRFPVEDLGGQIDREQGDLLRNVVKASPGPLLSEDRNHDGPYLDVGTTVFERHGDAVLNALAGVALSKFAVFNEAVPYRAFGLKTVS